MKKKNKNPNKGQSRQGNLNLMGGWGDKRFYNQANKIQNEYYKNPFDLKNRNKFDRIMGEMNKRKNALIDQSKLQGITGQGGDVMSGLLSQMMGQGSFNPQNLPEFGGYDEWRNKAQDSAMDYFNRNMQPQFDREDNEFRERMANEGVAPGTGRYENEFKSMKDAQERQRQNAMSGAFSAGQAEQAQQFGQTAQSRGQLFGEQQTQYQMPYQMMGSVMPFYNRGVDQFNVWDERQAQREYDPWALGFGHMSAIEHIRETARNRPKVSVGGGGGGGGGGDPWAGYYNQMLENYLNAQNQYESTPSGWGSFGQGFGQGAFGGFFG